jgi:hypothetical protein
LINASVHNRPQPICRKEPSTLEAVSFTVNGPNLVEDAVSMVTAITFTGTHYNLHRLDSCQPPIVIEPPDPCPGRVC